MDLERRDVPASPTALEQEMLEWVNRFRADPSAEFARYFDTVTQPNGTVTYLAKVPFLPTDKASIEEFRGELFATPSVAPLAWNTKLNEAARFHTDFMIAADAFDHELPGEPTLGNRIAATGYQAWSWGENIAYGQTQIRFAHSSLVHSDSHRDNLARATFTEIGIAAGSVTASNRLLFDPVVTQEFGSRGNRGASVLGVVFEDKISQDQFYNAGEGVQGVSVVLSGTSGNFFTTSWSSGGYQFDDVPAGSYRLYLSGPGLDSFAYSYDIVVSAANVKYDFRLGSPPGKTVGFENETVATVDEGGLVTFALVRSGPLDSAVEVTVQPTDRPGTTRIWNSVIEPLANGGTVRFESGQARATFQVRALQDNEALANATIDFVLSSVDPRYASGITTKSLTVADDDQPKVAVIKFAGTETVRVVRESDRQVIVSVERSGDLSKRVIVPYSIVPVSGQNYVASQSGTLVFEPGATHTQRTIVIGDDNVARNDGVFVFRLGSPASADAIVSGPSEQVITVVDDDPKPRLIRIAGRRNRQTLNSLTAVFDSPIRNTNTRNAALWQITDAGADGVFDSSDDMRIALRGVNYTARTKSFTMNFRSASKSKVARSYRIVLDASKLSSPLGTSLDGPMIMYLNV
jgi:uncharacterized protein YkwD